MARKGCYEAMLQVSRQSHASTVLKPQKDPLVFNSNSIKRIAILCIREVVSGSAIS